MGNRTLVPMHVLSYEEVYDLLVAEYDRLIIAIQDCLDLGDEWGARTLALAANEVAYQSNLIVASFN